MNKGRITITTLHDAAASLYNEKLFNTIAHLSLGYGVEGCKDTEVDFYETVTYIINAIKEEESQILVLGTCPRSITNSWVKVAEIAIKSTSVKIVIIPLAIVIKKDSENPTVNGSIIYINNTGIFQVEKYSDVLVGNFVSEFSKKAVNLNEKFVK